MIHKVASPEMFGVVTLLQESYHSRVEKLWHELEEQFQIPHLYDKPIAHFSYHVAAKYDEDKLKSIMDQFVKYKKTFKVRTEGLGVFNKSEPVVYIPVIRNTQLATFHRSLWELINPWAKDALSYYHPDSWMPHITLVHGNVPMEKLPHIVGHLASYDFNWEFEVSNLSIICSARSTIDPELQFKLPSA